MKVSTSDRLKYIMESRNIRQADILEMIQPYCEKYNINIPRNALSQYVTGKVLPKQDKLTILGMALNVSEAWLMGYDVPMERSTAPTDPSAREDFTDLTSTEKTLVSTFRTLNPNGQQLALTAMQSFAANPDLIKDTVSKAG